MTTYVTGLHIKKLSLKGISDLLKFTQQASDKNGVKLRQ